MATDERRPTVFTDLNGDCVDHLLQFLPLKDLNATNATCKFVRDIVRIRKCHRFRSCITQADIESLFHRYGKFTTDEKLTFLNDYLARYGNMIREMKFEIQGFKAKHDEIFNLVIEHCTDTLKSLRMSNVQLNRETIPKGEQIFSSLHDLEMVRPNLMHLSPILSFGMELRELTLTLGIDYIQRVDFNSTFFPKLQRFTLNYNYEECIKHDKEIPGLNAALDYFYEQHPGLVSFSLKLPHPLKIDETNQLICLEELYFNGSLQYETLVLTPLWSLANLKKMKIEGFYDYHCSDFLAKSEAVHTMLDLSFDLLTIDNDGFLQGLGRWSNLQTLSLSIREYKEVPANAWVNLENLIELTDLYLSDVEPGNLGNICQQFIRYLTGAHDTLQTLSINARCNMNTDFVTSLKQFKFLHTLTLEMEMDDIERNLQPFGLLESLKKLTLISKQSILIQRIQQNVIRRFSSLQKLEKLEFSNFSDDGVFVRNRETMQFQKM